MQLRRIARALVRLLAVALACLGMIATVTFPAAAQDDPPPPPAEEPVPDEPLPEVPAAPPAQALVAPSVFISEIHYDNTGADVGEFIEVTGPANQSLDGMSIVLYNGNGGAEYNTVDLTGQSIDDEDGVSGAIAVAIAGIQNGSPDGIALVFDDGAASTVIEFLSYEGTFAAVSGPATGLTSTDIGVAEPSDTPIGQSVQLNPTTLAWEGPAASSEGALNGTVTPPAPQVFISEIHYDNAGGDVGEFVEVEGPVGFDLTGWSVALYNGSNGTLYFTQVLSGAVDDEDGASGALAFPIAGIQNGSPDGIALIDAAGEVIEFVSYEGTLSAIDGPAAGLTSVDIGVTEQSTTPIGQSVQLIDGAWLGPVAESPGDLNQLVTAEPRFIHEIQGSGATSPLVGTEVIISGIVVGDFTAIDTGPDAANPDGDEPLRGIFVQEEDIDADADPSTSEGIFVFAPDASVAVGDLVEITGIVTEFFDLTEIAQVSDLTVISSGNPLPTAATPAVPTLPGEPGVDYEAIEGMRVEFGQPLYVTGLFPHGRFGEVQLSSINAQDHPNQVHPVGSAEAAALRAFNELTRVILDDGEDEDERFPAGLSTWNPEPTPFLGPEGTLRSGDVVNGLTGVVFFDFGEYEILPVNTANPLRPDEAVDITYTPRPTTVPDVGGSLTVASFNVLNYFVTLDDGPDICGPSGTLGCRGADTAQEFADQSSKIAAAIARLDADIVGLIELENSGTDAAIADLVTKVNVQSSRTYDFVPTGFIGTDAIVVGFIYDTSTVALQGDFAILDSSVSPAFIDDKNRPVLAQTFTELATGQSLTASVSHMKSKGSDCADVANPGDPAFGVAPYGAGADADVGDLVPPDPLFTGNCNLTREAAAQVLAGWMDSDPTGTGVTNTLILGDLNAYAQESPIQVIEAQGFTNLVGQFSGLSWAEQGHSFVFDGEHGSLDYAMANPELLAQVTGAAVWNINADETFAIDYQNFNPPGQVQPDNEFKSSDHDPVVIGVALVAPGPSCNGQAATIIGTDGDDVLWGTSGADVIVAGDGKDLVFGLGGDDVICLGDGSLDWAFGGGGNDIIFGEGGRDFVRGGAGNDVVSGGDGADILRGDRGNDELAGETGDDWLFGGRDDDFLDGGDDRDFASGSSGTDTCRANIESPLSCEVFVP